MNNASSNIKPNHTRSFQDQCNECLLFSRKKNKSGAMYKIIVQEQLQSICSHQF